MKAKRRFGERYRHAQLLVALALLLFADPFLEGLIGAMFVDVFLLIALISAVVACSRTKVHAIVGLALIVLMQSAVWYRAHSGVEAMAPAFAILGIVFFGFVTATILYDVFSRSHDVSADTICGALSAYLLLGVVWAFVFALVEVGAPGSFSGFPAGEKLEYDAFIGYSFVTLTTLGYGNVVPTTTQAESLAIAEAVVGQAYLTVLVARLVALNLAGARRSD